MCAPVSVVPAGKFESWTVKSAVAEGYTAGGDFSWHLRADKWVFDSEC